MRILVDMDGVIADFEDGFLCEWKLRHGDKPFIALEDRNTFYILDQYPPEDKPFIWQIFLMPGFFRNLPVIKGGLEALTEVRAAGLEVFICTSPFIQYQNCVLEKYEWIDQHFGPDWVEHTILTFDKTIVRADFLIDDRSQLTGADAPTWKHIIYDNPRNRAETTKKRLTWDNWKEVMLSEESFRKAFLHQD